MRIHYSRHYGLTANIQNFGIGGDVDHIVGTQVSNFIALDNDGTVLYNFIIVHGNEPSTF